jgi:hypothetical protein
LALPLASTLAGAMSITAPAVAQDRSGPSAEVDLVPGAIVHLSAECSAAARFDVGPPARFVVPAKRADAALEAYRNAQAEYQAERDKLSQSAMVRLP